ncbi:MAG: ABC transporter ATP-binding protein [Rhodothermia bacterium]
MIDLISKFWRVLERRERRQVLLTIAVLLASSLVQILGVGSILPFMAVLSTPDIIQSNQWLSALFTSLHFTSEPRFLFFLGLCSLGAVLISNACLALNQWITVHLSASIQRRLEVRLLEKYLQAPYLVHLRRSPAELKRNVLNETLQFSGIGNLGLQLVASTFLILCVTGVLLAVNPMLTLLLGAFIGGGYGLVYLVVRRRIAGIGRMRMDANLQRYKMVDEGLAGFKELRILQRTPWVMRRYTEAAGILTATLAKRSVLSTLPRYFIEVLGLGGMLLVVLYLLASQADVRATIPLISVFAFGAYRMLPAMQGVYSSTMGLRFHAPVARAIEGELCGVVEAKTVEDGGGEENAPLAFRTAVELRNVSFRFTQDRGWVLRDVTLTIPRGAFIGFAGETGAGKSTLADVILGLIPPDTGEVRVDGLLLRGSATRGWQQLLGYVPQEIYLADDTIEHNIAFGLPPEQIDGSAVRGAARLAQLDRFIEQELPEGYETLVGDRGVRLSGGQRQRIGIARALYHRPEVLVMDEATSMLDGETEARVFSALERLAGEITLIVIAHRLTTIKRADTIYLLEKGAVAVQGSFSELMESSRQFSNMAHSRSSATDNG